ncbi:MAG: dTDP-4-dehydrorhamnose 3,5-epimerase [Ignavibacteria bacterium]
MEFKRTWINDIIVINPKSFSDERGYFFESFKENEYEKIGIDYKFVQDNISRSVKGTLRGLHYQVGEFAQGKLCQVLSGEVLDVAVDIRFGSPTFGKYAGAILSGDNHDQIWIPPGFAHGFSVISSEAVFHYKCTQYYSKEHERSIYYADKDLKIDWNVANPLVSPKDKEAKLFKDIDKDFVF